MPTVFDQPEDGDVTHVAQLNQYAPAVNALERGLPFSAGTTAGTSTAYTATVFPGPADNEFGTLLLVYWHVDCGTDPTLALNGHAPLSIWKTEIAKVASGELKAGTFSLLQCNGTKWFLVGGGSSSGSTNASTAFSSGQVPLARGGTGADLSATGGSSQFLKQTSAGGAVSVAGILANDLPANIDCAKFANGQVSNTEFQYLDGVTSAIQTQIDGKAATSHNHAASAINSGQLALARGGTGADLSATGGGNQFLKQTSAGGAVTVAVIAAGDLPTHSTSLLVTGQLALARGGTGADLSATGGANQFLKQNSAGGTITVATIALDDLSDVVISSPANGQVVRHNGTNFVNAVPLTSDLAYSGYFAGKSADQSVALSTSADVTFTTNEQTSSDVSHSTVTNPAEFTINTTQKYAIDVQVAAFASTGAAWNAGEVRLYVNGVMVKKADIMCYFDGTTPTLFVGGYISWEGPITAGQIVKVVYANLSAARAQSVAGQSSSVNRTTIRIQGRGN